MCTKKGTLRSPYLNYQNALVDAGLLVETGVPGVYGLSGRFECTIECIERYVTKMGSHLAQEVVRFPPLLSRASYLKTGHLDTFPDLIGSVHSFTGGDKSHQEL